MDKTLGFIGILNRGRKILIGETAIYSVEKGSYAFLASDCSLNTKKAVNSALKNNPIPVNTAYSKAELGSAIGYNEISFMLLIDKKAAKKLIDMKEDDRK